MELSTEEGVGIEIVVYRWERGTVWEGRSCWGGVGEFLPELGVDWEIEPLVPLFLQNLRMFLTLTIEVLRDRESLPGARLFGLWSSGVESKREPARRCPLLIDRDRGD
jgi:hypothetical protein